MDTNVLHTWNRGFGLVFATRAGSHLYGTNRPESDIDIRGVCHSPRTAILGLQGFEQFQPQGSAAVEWSLSQDFPESDDVTIYSLNKFFSLCLNANPNILEMLFTPDQSRLFTSLDWRQVVDQREIFLSTKIVHTFAGYAYSQLAKIRRHQRWIQDPPTQPDITHFGWEGGEWINGELKHHYKTQQKDWKGYKTWIKNRNPARALLEKQYGYDTKHAMHLYRLILEATELLKDGHLTLPLEPDTRSFLMSVLNGAIPYDEVVQMGEESKDFLLSLEKDSPLPHGPDHVAAEELLMKLQWEALWL